MLSLHTSDEHQLLTLEIVTVIRNILLPNYTQHPSID